MNAQRFTPIGIGLFIMTSLTLAHFTGQVDLSKISWLWLATFVGLKLFQVDSQRVAQ